MKMAPLILATLLTAQYVTAQTFNISLSQKHSQKLSAIKSGHERLKKFYKFYKRDSTKSLKKQERYYKRLLDSAYRAAMKKDKIGTRLAKKGIVPSQKRLSVSDSLDFQLKRWCSVMQDSASSDSLKQLAKSKVKELVVKKINLYPGFQNLLDKHEIGGDTIDWKTVTNQVPGLDTLSELFDSEPDQLFALAEEQSVAYFEKLTGSSAIPLEFKEADRIRTLPDQYRNVYKQYTDMETLKTQGKQQAVDQAVDYFAKHADKLKIYQAKVSKLMSKYKDIVNSNDLSSAKKKTSMQGKTFWEHLVLGGNFNILSTDPVSIDLSPQLGYSFTTRFCIGVGMSYRHTFKDSINYGWYISPVNTGFKAFSNYNVLKGFYAYSEWERSNISQKTNDEFNHVGKNNYFVGIGKKFLIHPKIYMNTTLLYNLNNETGTRSIRGVFRSELVFS